MSEKLTNTTRSLNDRPPQTIGEKIAAAHYKRVGGTTMFVDMQEVRHYPQQQLAAEIDSALEAHTERVSLEKRRLEQCIQNNPDFEHIRVTCSGNEQVEALSEKLRAAYRVEYPSEWHRGFNEGLDAAKIIIRQHFAKEQGKCQK